MKCTQTVEVSFEDILANTPDEKIALFQITGIPSDMEDFWLGEYVYVTKEETLLDVINHRDIDGVPTRIQFVKYVTKGW